MRGSAPVAAKKWQAQALSSAQPAAGWRAGGHEDLALFHYAYQTRLNSLRRYFDRNFSSSGARKDPRGFLVSPRPVSRWAICRNISVVR